MAAVATISCRSPVYCAIWFGMTLAGTAGLFLLAGAEFLAVATIVVYAGAILVTFLFVLMLSQPEGHTTYDRRSWEALVSAFTGAVLVGILTATIGVGDHRRNVAVDLRLEGRREAGVEGAIAPPAVSAGRPSREVPNSATMLAARARSFSRATWWRSKRPGHAALRGPGRRGGDRGPGPRGDETVGIRCARIEEERPMPPELGFTASFPRSSAPRCSASG